MEAEKKMSNAESNRTYWDAVSGNFYKSLLALPSVIEMYAQLTQSILSRSTLDPEKTVLMDFACGNGELSAQLAPHCKAIVGVDISQKMVDSYNQRMETLGIDGARAFQSELTPNDPRLAGQKFDAIICAHSYKHIEDNVGITRVLKSYLKPNGALYVIDVIQGKASFQTLEGTKDLMVSAMKTLPARPANLMVYGGYNEEDMRKMFDVAGLVDFWFEEAFVKEDGESSFSLFLAKGVNPS